MTPVNRQTIRVALVACLGLSSLTGCAPAPRKTTTAAVVPRQEPPPRIESKVPPLKSYLAEDWYSGATRLDSGDGSIFFYGTSQRTSPENEPWLGTVEGDILYVSPRQAILISAGKLTLTGGNSFKISGSHRAVVPEPGKPLPWKSLLL
jgi:hypothetical protein